MIFLVAVSECKSQGFPRGSQQQTQQYLRSKVLSSECRNPQLRIYIGFRINIFCQTALRVEFVDVSTHGSDISQSPSSYPQLPLFFQLSLSTSPSVSTLLPSSLHPSLLSPHFLPPFLSDSPPFSSLNYLFRSLPSTFFFLQPLSQCLSSSPFPSSLFTRIRKSETICSVMSDQKFKFHQHTRTA